MELEALYQKYIINHLVDTDTRKIRKGSIFFALKGDNFDGNKYAKEALNLGATFAVIDDKKYQKDQRYILVDNALETLQALAKHHRAKLSIPIIALTGSNGKTTTKELINAVLSKKFNTIATIGNLNNHIGVPLTLLSITNNTELAIIEMGANHCKEIEFLSKICKPDFGYITNFGKAHLEGFGGVEGVIKGKSELYDFLKLNDKTALVNPADEIQFNKSAKLNRILFSKNLKFIDANPFVHLNFKEIKIKSNLIGSYNYTNIAAAISLGAYFNISKELIKEAIENYIPKNNRSQIITTANNNTIILDAYNANPSSVKVALESFKQLEAPRKILILGDMFELGISSDLEHQQIADLAISLSFDEYYFVGKNFAATKISYPKYKDFSTFQSAIQKNEIKEYHILIKGSRGMALERILPSIK